MAAVSPDRVREERRVRAHVLHSYRRGLGRSLTLAEWERTLAHFRDCCAFCGTSLVGVDQHVTLDHYRPQALGGGTVVYNVLPVCVGCQRDKGDLPPAAWKGTLRRAGDDERLRRVRLAEEYLAEMKAKVL